MTESYSEMPCRIRSHTDRDVEPLVETGSSRETSEDSRQAVEEAVRRLALFLEKPPRIVERNVPGSIQEALSRLPWERRLQRRRDHVVLQDLRFLWERMDADDLRRPRLKYMLEHAERRSRL